jgi:DNA polymerase I-like protein with 3'-5' exonuclease and polymerase domains
MGDAEGPVKPWVWDDQKVIAHDLETSGSLPEYALQPWRLARGDAWVTSASAIKFAPGEGLVAHLSQLFPTKEHLAGLLEDAIANDWTVLGWNIAFDIGYLIALGLTDLVMRVRWLDGMLLWRHLDIEPEYEFSTRKHLKKSYRLKPEAVATFIPTFAGLDEDVDFHATDPESLAKLQRYNDRDNVRCWTIARIIWHKLSPRQQQAAVLEAACLPLVAQANVHGLVIDQLTARHLGAKLTLDAAARLHELAPDGMTEKIVRSPLQLAKLMFDAPEDGGWALPVLKTNKSKVEGKADSRSTDKEVLHELAFLDPRVRKVKEYREALNAKGKFCDSVLESVAYNEDGRTHPIAKVFATYTGRLTVSSKQGKGASERPIGFALHQMKREKEFREIVTVEDGYDIVEVDAAGQEFRWMAVASRDQTMLHLCTPGEDAHSYMGAAIVHEDYQELIRKFHVGEPAAVQTRYLGKFSNLSLQYRTSARKLRSKARVDYNIPLELPEAQRIWKTYQETYPGVPVYWREQIAIVKSCGYVETFGGRRVQVVGNWDGEWGWSMGSTAINTRIQGTGADQKYLALAVLKDYVNGIGGRLMYELHDGLYFAIPSHIRRTAVDVMKHLLDNLPYQQAWGFTPPVPMPWDVKAGKAWGRLKEVRFE